MSLRILSLWLLLGVTLFTSGCQSGPNFVLASNSDGAVGVAAMLDDARIARERKGVAPGEGYRSWLAFWHDRYATLRRLSEQSGDFAEPSRRSLAYIKRRRAEEGLPAYD